MNMGLLRKFIKFAKKIVMIMNDEKMSEELLQNEAIQPKGAQKKFHGFSMGFLLLLLGLVVAVYVVCTILSA